MYLCDVSSCDTICSVPDLFVCACRCVCVCVCVCLWCERVYGSMNVFLFDISNFCALQNTVVDCAPFKRNLLLYYCPVTFDTNNTGWLDWDYGLLNTYSVEGSSCNSVVVYWTAGQQVERLILHQGHDSYQNSSL